MEEQDLEPRTKRKKLKDLEIMSIEALEEYIAEMESEIERARAEIASKKDHRSAAEDVFKN
jgi:uncharacterized small protein (DUF1192 family)